MLRERSRSCSTHSSLKWYPGINLTKVMTDLYSENFKYLRKETEEDIKTQNVSYAHELIELVWLNHLPICRFNAIPIKKLPWPSSQKWNKNPKNQMDTQKAPDRQRDPEQKWRMLEGSPFQSPAILQSYSNANSMSRGQTGRWVGQTEAPMVGMRSNHSCKRVLPENIQCSWWTY